MYFRLLLVSTKNNTWEPEPGNDVMTFVSLWPIRFHDRMKLECSLQQIPHTVILGLLELNCDWLKIPMSQKSFPGSGSQTLFSVETSNSRKYVCVRRITIQLLCSSRRYPYLPARKGIFLSPPPPYPPGNSDWASYISLNFLVSQNLPPPGKFQTLLWEKNGYFLELNISRKTVVGGHNIP